MTLKGEDTPERRSASEGAPPDSTLDYRGRSPSPNRSSGTERTTATLPTAPSLRERRHSVSPSNANGLCIADFFDDSITGALVQQALGMAPGDRFASERTQARHLGISRTALRDRLTYLESVGLLERRAGSGTFIRGLRTENVSTILAIGLMAYDITLSSLNSVRLALERQAAYEAANSGDPRGIAQMGGALALMQIAQDPDALYDSDVAFHRGLFVAAASPALSFLADSLSSVLNRSLRQRQDRILALTHDSDHIRWLHERIYEAVIARDCIQAMASMDAHFDHLDEAVRQARVAD